MKNNKLLSIGIDIGTTTFQMVISELTVENEMPSCEIPKFQITEKKIVYRSRIYFTPVLGEKLLDMERIRYLLNEELKKSGIPKCEIESGAIIVTGEAANRLNAESAAKELADFAGDFVVAVAGPDLEASLAGYGSGAAELSEREQLTLANLDIGGGTTNVSVFEKGHLCDRYALHIGGRMVRLDFHNRIVYVSEKLLPLLREEGIYLKEGEIATVELIHRVSQALAKVLVRVISGESLSGAQSALRIYHGNRKMKLDGCTVSGGIGELLNLPKPVSLEEIRRFGDIGPALAAELKRQIQLSGLRIYDCSEKIRATVIGAGMHSMQLSGSTICYDSVLLPLKNRPVVIVQTDLFSGTENAICQEMQHNYEIYQEQIVFCFQGHKSPTYKEVKRAAMEIWKFYRTNQLPILLIFKYDLAKVMGQTLGILSDHSRAMVCIDSVEVEQGDYVDFCKAVGETILVTVKTLLYKN